jgi:hypothetical protein
VLHRKETDNCEWLFGKYVERRGRGNLKVLTQNLSGRFEEIHKRLHSGQPTKRKRGRKKYTEGYQAGR